MRFLYAPTRYFPIERIDIVRASQSAEEKAERGRLWICLAAENEHTCVIASTGFQILYVKTNHAGAALKDRIQGHYK